jgi:hypothetical protein
MTTRRLQRSTSVVSREIDDEVLLVPLRERVHDLDDCVFYVDSPVGRLVWNLLREPHTEEELLTEILGRFSVQREQARADLAQFMEELTRAGAVVER